MSTPLPLLDTEGIAWIDEYEKTTAGAGRDGTVAGRPMIELSLTGQLKYDSSPISQCCQRGRDGRRDAWGTAVPSGRAVAKAGSLTGTGAPGQGRNSATSESLSPKGTFMGDTLRVGGELGIGQYLQGGAYRLTLQRDGNLVLSEPKGAVVWETKTQGLDVRAAVLQDDGNFVLYSPNGAVWSTDTNGKAVDKLIVQADRNVVLYDKDDNPLWASQTFTNNPITVN
ncbi:hypothetical protein [Streptomyces sp. NPDC002403]